MRGVIPLLLVCCGAIPLLSLSDQQITLVDETTVIAPASDGVEVDEICIIRRIALGATKGADLTNMKMVLWFTATWDNKDDQSNYLVRLTSLNPIKDSASKLLLTTDRKNAIGCLHAEVRGDVWRSSGGKEGPLVRLLLDAPTRGAERIEELKGSAEVSTVKLVNLEFDDLAVINGNDLEHKEMKSLREMKLRFEAEVKDGQIKAKVMAPMNYASPWNQGRLQDWSLINDSKTIGISSQGVSHSKEGFTVEKTYRHNTLKGLALRLVVLEPLQTKRFMFNFKNIELP